MGGRAQGHRRQCRTSRDTVGGEKGPVTEQAISPRGNGHRFTHIEGISWLSGLGAQGRRKTELLWAFRSSSMGFLTKSQFSTIRTNYQDGDRCGHRHFHAISRQVVMWVQHLQPRIRRLQTVGASDPAMSPGNRIHARDCEPFIKVKGGKLIISDGVAGNIYYKHAMDTVQKHCYLADEGCSWA